MRAIKDMFFGIGGDPGPDQVCPANMFLEWYEAEYDIEFNIRFDYDNIHEVLEALDNDQPVIKAIDVLDYMLKGDLFDYSCDVWGGPVKAEHYKSLKEFNGQVNYKDNIFVITRYSAKNGMGGMDQGSPAGVHILKIKQ